MKAAEYTIYFISIGFSVLGLCFLADHDYVLMSVSLANTAIFICIGRFLRPIMTKIIKSPFIISYIILNLLCASTAPFVAYLKLIKAVPFIIAGSMAISAVIYLLLKVGKNTNTGNG